MIDKILTYRYPRTMAEAASRYPCNGEEAVAVHGPYRKPLVADNWIAIVVVALTLIVLGVNIVQEIF